MTRDDGNRRDEGRRDRPKQGGAGGKGATSNQRSKGGRGHRGGGPARGRDDDQPRRHTARQVAYDALLRIDERCGGQS
ncbi:MAG TPA: hypothetical protein PLV68_00020, partial [Ilumatobacteraceae bacterium]|nr:hypothetical protein [Ilumatobacteraceae bacterium]